MKSFHKRRLAVVGLPVFLGAALVIGGCSASNSGATSSASGGPEESSSAATGPVGPSSAARSALIASVQQLNQTTYRYHAVSGGLSGEGAADPTHKAATVSMTGTNRGDSGTIDMVALGADFWLKLNLGKANQSLGISSTKWLHLDASRLGANANLPVDPSGGSATASAVFSGVTRVQQVDSQHFTGTVDLTRATGATGIAQQLIAQAGPKATAVPFTATVDGQGRLTDLKLDLSGIDPSLALEVSYSDFGTPVTVTRPDPSAVVDAPNSVYQFFQR